MNAGIFHQIFDDFLILDEDKDRYDDASRSIGQGTR